MATHRGANVVDMIASPVTADAPETPVIPIRQSDLIIANGTDRLPRYLLDWDKTQAALREPFDPDDIYFLPQTVNYTDKTAIAAAYADSRVYSARMNLVIGAGFWQSKVDRVDVAAFTKVIRAKLDWKAKDEAGNAKVLEPARDVAGNKVGVTDRVGIWMGPMLGWVWHDSTGAKDTADENWITTGEAQAYKRAMMKWGPGEYLYHLPKQSCPYDTKVGRWKQQPVIPDWAYPNHVCADCDAVIDHYNYTDKDGHSQSRHFWDIVLSTRTRFGRQLCPVCAKQAQAAQVVRLGVASCETCASAS
jgi:hypothetical protein